MTSAAERPQLWERGIDSALELIFRQRRARETVNTLKKIAADHSLRGYESEVSRSPVMGLFAK